MSRRLILFLLLLPTAIFAQNEKQADLEKAISKGWTALAKDWRYQVGDNSKWADAGFDDSSWKHMSEEFLDNPDSSDKTDKNAIVWFRKKLKFNPVANQQVVMHIDQAGASEIYLDGKLIHKLGTVSANPDSIVHYNPRNKLLEFPLVRKNENVLAIRYVNLPQRFPVYGNEQSGIRILLSSLNYISNKDEYNDYVQKYFIVAGVAAFMTILFFCYFIFFPNEKVNLYFSLSSFFFTCFILSMVHLDKAIFWNDLLHAVVLTAYILLFYYTSYRIFNVKTGVIYWFVFSLGLVGIAIHFFYTGDTIQTVIAVLVLVDSLRLSFNSIKTDKMRAAIFLFFNGLNALFWIAVLLSLFTLANIPVWKYQPFAFLLAPMSIAIYLGYSFGIKSQTLRHKLAEVEQLSGEKQQLLANQNEMLELQVNQRTAELNASLENLKATQTQLIQSEKMASLGELTAGIAHEIQNPLNFVNNFSEVSNEMIDEMNDELDKGDLTEAKAIASDIKQNLEKINHHGKRADAIVKGMLQHSRNTSGAKEPTDINSLADEYMRLSYHGMRSKDKTFNATLQTDFDGSIGKIGVIPQDLGRVILNLITNAFYAVNEKKQSNPQGYEPTVSIGTQKNQDRVEIRISDNGNGIPPHIIDKIFQPFFTTKPTGQGTGLGLSLAYDIITKGHMGELKVTTIANEETCFIISIPL